jgi:dUTP pyrophosphatase
LKHRGFILSSCYLLWPEVFAFELSPGDHREETSVEGERIQVSSAVQIKVKRLVESAKLPRYAHVGEYGDLAADLYASEGLILEPGATIAVPTGVAMEFPSTHGALVEDRSGLAMKAITTLAGVIDPGYRGEIRVVVTNLSSTAIEIQPGDRIAQLRIVQRIQAEFSEVEELGEAARGAGGFGSTGT